MSQFAIRPYRLTDIDAVYEAADESREHVSKWMCWMTPFYNRTHAEQWVRHAVSARETGKAYEYLITEMATGQVAGSCGLNKINRLDLVCNLGYWVRRSFLGQGAAPQAVLALKRFAFYELHLVRLEIVVAAGNEASQKVARRVGGIHEGMQAKRLRVGEFSHDAHMFALINPDVD